MVINGVLMADIVKMAREYDKTKSITTATETCKKLIEWANKNLGIEKA